MHSVGWTRTLAAAVVVCTLVLALTNSVASAQGTSGTGITQQDIIVRDELIANQESLLNTYRCRFNIDTQIVPGGCAGGQPSEVPTVPEPFSGTPSQHEVDVRVQITGRTADGAGYIVQVGPAT